MLLLGDVNMLWLVAAGLIGAASYLVALFIQRRSFYHGLPCPPHSMFWGHLKLMGEYMDKLPRASYIHNVVTQMKMDYDLPDIFYIDLWPAGPSLIVCASPDACAISTTTNAFQMPSIVSDYFKGTIGTSFIEATNGTLWKNLHHMMAPGLTPNSVKSYSASMIEQAVALHNRLRDMSQSAQLVDMRYQLGLYAYQVIATAFFGEPLSADIYKDFKNTTELQLELNATKNPLAKVKLHRDVAKLWRRIEADFEPKISARFATLQKQTVLPTKATATNLLDRMLTAQIESGKPLDNDLVKIILENAKGSVVAGYGTTTDTSSYMLMMLEAFPEALKNLREEHDRFFHKDFDKTVEELQANPGIIKELKYTTVVINETLRMFPIALGVRDPPSDSNSFVYKGRAYPTDGHLFAIATHTVHYNPEYFPEPKKFKPERFLDDEPVFSRHAFRPFERGLRSCLGQSLAMDEMKVLLVLIARWFDFELREQGANQKPAVAFTDMDTKIGKHAFQTWSYTAGPAGAVMMKVRQAKD